jgi:iron complex transport system substrate-binding protein
MKKLIAFLIAILFLEISCFPQGNENYPNRIVSLSPSITEILYELNLGDRVVGVTDHCNFPEDVKNKTRIGGYLNINYEAIILLKPDILIASTDYSEEIKDVFDKAGIEYMAVNTLTVEGIFDSIVKIGRRNGVGDRAKEVVARMRKDIDGFKKKPEEKPSKRVMIVVGRNRGSFENLYIAGKNTFYDELLNILGCENVYIKSGLSYPTLSLEGIIRLNPDIIIEVLPNCSEDKKSEVIAEWRFLDNVNAVKNNKVYVFNKDYICIPGPRLTLILKDMAGAL